MRTCVARAQASGGEVCVREPDSPREDRPGAKRRCARAMRRLSKTPLSKSVAVGLPVCLNEGAICSNTWIWLWTSNDELERPCADRIARGAHNSPSAHGAPLAFTAAPSVVRGHRNRSLQRQDQRGHYRWDPQSQFPKVRLYPAPEVAPVPRVPSGVSIGSQHGGRMITAPRKPSTRAGRCWSGENPDLKLRKGRSVSDPEERRIFMARSRR